MRTSKTLMAVAAGAMALMTTTAAKAAVTTFATYTPFTGAKNVRWASTGNSSTRINDATFFTIATDSSTAVPGSVNVKFSFLQPELNAYVNNITAAFTMFVSVPKGSSADPISNVNGTPFTQPGLTGTMSFLSTSAITVGGPDFEPFTYVAGSNLLTITFGSADLTGKIGATSGSGSASTGGGDTVTFTSDFLDFDNTVNRDLGLTLTSVTPGFVERTGNNKALANFRASQSGQFSSDPAPLINGLAVVVPEPAMWSLMIAGFGMVGLQVRRRRSASVTA